MYYDLGESIVEQDYRAHFERVCKVNGWTTAQDKAKKPHFVS